MNVRVAIAQAGSVLFDRERTLSKLEALAADAARRGAQLIVFPEAFVGGYPKGSDFGVRLGQRSPEGRELFRRYFEDAIEVPGPIVERIGRTAREHAVHLVVGVVERGGGTLYCSALIFGSDGSLLGKHRKLMPTALERVVWGCGDGSTLPVVATPIGKIGAVICWENYMPLLRTAMYARGVELYCAITVDDRETWLSTVRHIALEGRCFVISACQYWEGETSESDSAVGSPGSSSPAAPAGIRGGSCVIGPLGEVLAGPEFGGERIVTADLDLADLIRARLDFDVVGHYARPDVFQLLVDEQPKTSVKRDGGDVA